MAVTEREFWVNVKEGADELAFWDTVSRLADTHGCEIIGDRRVQWGSSLGRDIPVRLEGDPHAIDNVEEELRTLRYLGL